MPLLYAAGRMLRWAGIGDFFSDNLGEEIFVLFTVNIIEQMLQKGIVCLLYTSPSPRDGLLSRMPSSA